MPFLSGTCHSASVAPRESSFTTTPLLFVIVYSFNSVPSAVLPKSVTFTSANTIIGRARQAHAEIAEIIRCRLKLLPRPIRFHLFEVATIPLKQIHCFAQARWMRRLVASGQL